MSRHFEAALDDSKTQEKDSEETELTTAKVMTGPEEVSRIHRGLVGEDAGHLEASLENPSAGQAKTARSKTASSSSSTSSDSFQWTQENGKDDHHYFDYHKRQSGKHRRILQNHVKGAHPKAKRFLDQAGKFHQIFETGDHAGLHQQLRPFHAHLSGPGDSSHRRLSETTKADQCKLLMDCVGKMSICKSSRHNSHRYLTPLIQLSLALQPQMI